MKNAPPDEYQDGLSAGSLVKARDCWLYLVAAGARDYGQRFTVVFHCPTRRMAFGLTDFLRYAAHAGFVRAADGGDPGRQIWRVAGTTRAAIWSLSSLEHLFMRLRQAGTRYGSALATLNLVPPVSDSARPHAHLVTSQESL